MLLAPPLAALLALAQAPSPCGLTLEPREVRPGDSTLLTWACPQAPQVRLEPGGMVLPPKFQVTLRPSYTTTYRIYDARPGGAELGRAEIKVVPGMPLGEPARICSFDASAQAVLPGEPVVLRWECAGSAKVRLEPGGLELDGKNEITVTPLESTRYTITANNAAGGQSRTLEVAVMGHLSPKALPAAAPVCTFTASAPVVRKGEQVELRWSCGPGVKVRLEPGGLELDGQSSIAVVPDRTTVYTLSAANLMGGSSRSLEVRVEEPRIVLTERDIRPEDRASGAAEAEPALADLDLPGALARGERLREAAPAGSWSVQLVTTVGQEGIRKVAQAAGDKAAQVLILPLVRKDGIRFWQAFYGTHPSRVDAQKAWRDAPEALRKAFRDAWVKPLPKKPTR